MYQAALMGLYEVTGAHESLMCGAKALIRGSGWLCVILHGAGRLIRGPEGWGPPLRVQGD